MTIKKAFVELVELLEANESLTVAEVLPEVIKLASAKTGNGGGKASKFHKNEEGEVVAIQCYYHKLWMDPREVEFGLKANSPTGLNNMCKDGVSKWTAQQRKAKQAESELLARISSGDLDVADLAAAQAEIEAARTEVVPREDGYGFETLEELLEA